VAVAAADKLNLKTGTAVFTVVPVILS